MDGGELPWRSGATTLGDEELLLLDAFALNGPLEERMLRGDRYGDMMNVVYGHGLSDRALRVWVATMCGARKVLSLVRYADGGRQRYRLTRAGGLLWERERRPVWSKYVTTGYHVETGVLRIVSGSRGAGGAFLRAAHVSGLLSSAERVGAWRRVPRSRFRYWAPISPCWEWSRELPAYDDMHWSPGEEYERQRSWWDTIEELRKFTPGARLKAESGTERSTRNAQVARQ